MGRALGEGLSPRKQGIDERLSRGGRTR